jgi:hypothetical protein
VAFLVFNAAYYLAGTALIWGIFEVRDVLGTNTPTGWSYYFVLILVELVSTAIGVLISREVATTLFGRWDRIFIILTLIIFSVGMFTSYFFMRSISLAGLAVNTATMVGVWMALSQYGENRTSPRA